MPHDRSYELIAARVTPAQAERLRQYAKARERTISAEIRLALAHVLKEDSSASKPEAERVA